MKKLIFLIAFLPLTNINVWAQKVTIDGYVFEKYNRGFLNSVKITALDPSGVVMAETGSDIDGHFTFELPVGGNFDVQFEKKVFSTGIEKVSTQGKNAGETVYIKREMEREPGYLLEVTLAEKRASEDIPVDAVNGSRIEIYNHTTKKAELVIESAKSPTFSHTLQQGNEYTILVRKNGFFNKRMHANVNINGCYLCMDGFGTVNPGVVSNLTAAENNKLGTLLSNVELERIDSQRNIVLQNIYYGYNLADITEPSKKELDKVVMLLRTNPHLIVELGSHTDARGSDEFNRKLSQSRAQAAVDYIVASGWVEADKLKARGYGEARLVNKCDDGMPCNEDEHRMNRRTELKILGFTDNAFEGKSLVEIIHEEELMAFVLNNESEKSYVGTAAATAKNDKVAPNANAPKAALNDAPKGNVPPQKAANAMPTKTKTAAVNAPKTLKDNGLPAPKVKVSTANVPANDASKTSMTKTEEFGNDMPFKRPDVPAGEKAEPQKRETAAAFDVASTREAEESNQNSTVRKEEPLTEPVAATVAPKNTETVESDIKVNLKPMEKFSGYKVEIFASKTPLSIAHPDLKMIAYEVTPDISFDKLPSGVTSYMVGTFLGWGETERYLEKIAAKYPQARIVEYFDGKRLGGQ